MKTYEGLRHQIVYPGPPPDLDQVAQVALSSKHTVWSSYYAAFQMVTEGIPGDFVECGVYAGAQVIAMAAALVELPHDGNRRIHLFDSFEGIPEPGPEDGEFRAAGHHRGLSACRIEYVQGMMDRFGVPKDLLVYHKGWFEDTIPEFAKRNPSIALLRLDGDLYSSTKVCLEHLYPRLSKGGVCIVDDYALDGCRKAVHEVIGNIGPIYFRKD